MIEEDMGFKEVVVRSREPACLGFVPWAGPAVVISPERIVDEGWLLRVPLATAGGRSALLASSSVRQPHALRVSTEQLKMESPAGAVVRRLAFEPSEPWLTRDSRGVVHVKARYRGPAEDRLTVVPAEGRFECRMREVHRFESYGYFEACVPAFSGLLSLKVVSAEGEAWWTPASGLGFVPKFFEAPSADGWACPAGIPELVQERHVRRGLTLERRAGSILLVASLDVEISDLLELPGLPTGSVFLRMRDLLPSECRRRLGGGTLPLFSATEEVLTRRGVVLVASVWQQMLSGVFELARRGALSGLVVDWADQLPADLLESLFSLACVRDGSLELVMEGAGCDGLLTRTRPGTAAGRTYWPFVDQLSAHAGEAWLRLRPEALCGWRPDSAAVSRAGAQHGVIVRADDRRG